MERWRERRSLGRVLIKKKEELKRKREWMKMLVRILLQLRHRIGLKAQVKTVRKLGHQGLAMEMPREVRVLMTRQVGSLVGGEVEGVLPPAHLAGEVALAAAVLLLLLNLPLQQVVSLLLGREVAGVAGAGLQVGQGKMVVMVRQARRRRMVGRRSHRGERVRGRNQGQNRRVVATRGGERLILKRRGRRRRRRMRSESELERSTCCVFRIFAAEQ